MGQHPRRGVGDEPGARRRVHLRGRRGRVPGDRLHDRACSSPASRAGGTTARTTRRTSSSSRASARADRGRGAAAEGLGLRPLPGGTDHTFVGAGDGPCVIFMVGVSLPPGLRCLSAERPGAEARRRRRRRRPTSRERPTRRTRPGRSAGGRASTACPSPRGRAVARRSLDHAIVQVSPAWSSSRRSPSPRFSFAAAICSAISSS